MEFSPRPRTASRELDPHRLEPVVSSAWSQMSAWSQIISSAIDHRKDSPDHDILMNAAQPRKLYVYHHSIGFNRMLKLGIKVRITSNMVMRTYTSTTLIYHAHIHRGEMRLYSFPRHTQCFYAADSKLSHTFVRFKKQSSQRKLNTHARPLVCEQHRWAAQLPLGRRSGRITQRAPPSGHVGSEFVPSTNQS